MSISNLTKYGHWVELYQPQQLPEGKRPTPKAIADGKVWTWVRGPDYDGDADCIIPGYHPMVAVRVFQSQQPYIPGVSRAHQVLLS